MKKFFLAFVTLALCGISAFAQNEPVVTEIEDESGKTVSTVTYSKNVMTNDFKYNWELIGLLGTQFYYGDNDKYMKFGERFTFPAADIMINKWASPSIGFAFGITGLKMKGVYQTVSATGEPFQDNPAHFRTNDVYQKNYMTQGSVPLDLSYQKGWYVNPFIVAMFDLSNMIGGLKADRFYTAQWYAGGGVMLGMDKDGDFQFTNARGVSFNTGLLNKFRINERWDAVLNLRGALVSDDFDGECREHDEPWDREHITKNFPFDGIAGITAGLCLHFGVKKDLHTWKRASDTATEHTLAPIVLPAEKIIVHDTVKVDVPMHVDPSVWFHINFRIDKTNIVARERVNINSISDFIKTTPDTKYLLVGFADMQTSYPAHNLWLSEHRVKNVYDMMVSEFGVNPDQLEIDYKGGVDYMFYNKEELSRCVMVIPLEGKNIDEYGERHLAPGETIATE